ncbi:MAG: 4Fe-4S binding protein [Anaerolineae bacterium]|nr:4Fe-4S binding protein [Anaerolineae bacterium]
MSLDPYRRLAARLNELPEGFPPTADGAELRLLAKLYTPQEADLVADLRLTRETHTEIAARTGGNARETRHMLKNLARRGLIAVERTERGVGYGLMPFVVGFWENQAATLDAELAGLFEAYFAQAHRELLGMQPAVHRVVPVQQRIDAQTEIRPYDSVVDLIDRAQAWGVTECICRKQKALIGEPCDHPLEVCMILSSIPGAFDDAGLVRALSRDEALATLRTAAEAGLVHSVANSRTGTWYICNCCTCACGVLRGIAEAGAPAVIAPSSCVNRVDEEICIGCGLCVDHCPFGALSVDEIAVVDAMRCVGCGVCTLSCPQGALALVSRPEGEIAPPPEDRAAWRAARAAARGLDLERVR